MCLPGSSCSFPLSESLRVRPAFEILSGIGSTCLIILYRYQGCASNPWPWRPLAQMCSRGLWPGQGDPWPLADSGWPPRFSRRPSARRQCAEKQLGLLRPGPLLRCHDFWSMLPRSCKSSVPNQTCPRRRVSNGSLQALQRPSPQQARNSPQPCRGRTERQMARSRGRRPPPPHAAHLGGRPSVRGRAATSSTPPSPR